MLRRERIRPGLSDANGSGDEVAQFDAIGEAWWDEDGPMGPLHRLNPTRIAFIRDTAVQHFGREVSGSIGGPLSGLTVLDIGCGAGLLAEPLARLGASVTGIDPGETNIAVARQHATALGVAVNYRATTVEAVATERKAFDIVIASEVVEHVDGPAQFVATACGLVRPGGVFVASTLNRTLKSFVLAIVGAEYVLRWLPRGTHDWQRFVTPAELGSWTRRAGLSTRETRGMIFNPLRDEWSLGRDTDVNYIMAAARPTREV